MKKCVFLIALIILSCQTIWAQADFTADTTSGCSPLVINFQDLSNNAVSWQWDFGNGNTSNLKNPGTTYIQPGTYTVRLTIGLSGGGNQTVTKTNYITIHERPQAQFDATNPANCIGDPVQFNDLSVPGSGAITQWLWDFGDGSTSTFSDPTYTFPLVGSYTITLAVRDENGCNSVLVEPNYISVNDYPDASFSADNTLGCDPPFAVQFTSEGTTGLNHFWDFGNGDTSTVVHPNYIFRQRGAFSITHVVYDAAGCSDTVRHEQMVSIGQNEVNIQVSDSVVCLGEPIQFMCGARPGSTVSWDFGDGGNSTSCDVSHSYAAAGTYTASLSITDAEGCTYTGTKTIVIGEAPDANFDTDPALLCEAPFTVNFTNTSVNSGAVTYLWEFSDGATYTTEHVTHTFPDNPPEFQPYLYNISLTVTNEAGCSAVERRVNHIVSGHTVAAIQAMPRSGCAPLAVQFMDSSFSTSTLNSWLWDFGDGNTSSLQNPLHTYADTGLYDVTLTVGTTDGCTSTTVFGQYIDMGQAVAGDFDAAPTLACAQQPIQFNLLTTGVDSVRWLFGDGGESTDLNPEHAYTDVGQFDVSLITYKRGCGDTLTKFQFVDIQPPIARFSMSGSIGCQLPFEVIFTDESIGADSWEWDFGDGATSTEQNPRHTYTQAGSYVVTLRVRNSAAGCEYAIDNVVNVVPLDVSFQASDTSGCFPFAVSFTDLSVNAISWEWDFGDGNTSTEPNPTHIYQAPGSYHVQLKVSNVLGCLDSLIRYDYITAWGPDVRFEVVDSSDCAPFNIQFYNNTSSLAPVVAWEWNLGEGPLSNEQAPQHLYTQAGYYDISLTATDSVGCTASDTLFNYILITDPVADFEVSDTLNCPGNEVLFTNLSQGVGLSYLWEFGDGNTSNLANPRHVYTNVGTYAVKLSVTDVNNCPADTVKVDYIVVHEPMVDFTADTTMADCPPLLVQFTPSVFSVHQFDTWQWNFGDGTISFQQQPQHLYGLAGDYDVRLIAITPGGCRDTVFYPNMIHVDGPTGDFDFDPKLGCPGQQVDFSATSPNTTSFKWDFGDGGIDSGQVVSHVYYSSGVYRPILILQDGVGCEVVIPSTDSVLILPQPVAAFVADRQVLCEPGAIAFTDSSTSGFPISSWLWDFGDGNTSTEQHPTHVYSSRDDYDVSLVVRHDQGCSDTLLVQDFIRLLPPPVARMGISDTAGCAPLSITVEDQSLPGSVPLSSRWWHFGVNNDTSALANEVYEYAATGTYTLTLAVADSLGCTDTLRQRVHSLPSPQANFLVSDSLGCVPQTVSFTDLSPAATTWHWDFGDGTVSTEQHPQHLYLSGGRFNVLLVVTDTNGCADSLLRQDYLSLENPQAAFGLNDSVLCPGETLILADQSTSRSPLSSWQWDLGDATQLNGDTVAHIYAGPGFYDLRLVVTDSLGCRDTLLRPALVEVLMNEQPLPPDMYYVSVRSDNEIEVAFAAYPNAAGDFGSYQLYRQDAGGNFTQIMSTSSLVDTVLRDMGVNATQQPYCYRIQVSNYCSNPSDLNTSETHCSMDLQATPQLDAIALNWPPYTGWGQVDAYNVYAVNGYGAGGQVLLATVAAGQTSFVDTSTFCYDPKAYRIEAVNVAEGVVSWSDTASAAPLHQGPQSGINVLNATVVNNEAIEVEWAPLPPGESWVELLLERDSGFGFEELLRIPAHRIQQLYLDEEVDVQERAYAYRLFGIDECGDRTLLGLVGKSLHLQAVPDSAGTLLSWNPYLEWQGGVAGYQIQFYLEAFGQYVTIGEVGGNVLSFTDTTGVIQQGHYCYRVLAFEAGGNFQQSVSNEVCVRNDPDLHLPNAFTPNNDGINDVFLLKGVFVNGFYMAIYDRWGRQVFESRDINMGWDGRYMGRDMPEGVYAVVVWGLGFDGQRIKRTGTLTLIR